MGRGRKFNLTPEQCVDENFAGIATWHSFDMRSQFCHTDERCRWCGTYKNSLLRVVQRVVQRTEEEHA